MILHCKKLGYKSGLGEQAVKRSDQWKFRSWSLGDLSTRKNGVRQKRKKNTWIYVVNKPDLVTIKVNTTKTLLDCFPEFGASKIKFVF